MEKMLRLVSGTFCDSLDLDLDGRWSLLLGWCCHMGYWQFKIRYSEACHIFNFFHFMNNFSSNIMLFDRIYLIMVNPFKTESSFPPISCLINLIYTISHYSKSFWYLTIGCLLLMCCFVDTQKQFTIAWLNRSVIYTDHWKV